MTAKVKVEIVKPQKGPQTAFVECTSVDVVCYGGSRGGGKSWAMALDFFLHAERYGPDARGLMLRKTREDLKDFIDLATRMFGDAARYSEKGNTFKFTNGAKLVCAYLENESDAANFQGWSLTRVYFDELTQLNSLDPIMALLATLRSPKGIHGQLKVSCNPGGPSHHAVKEMFVDNGPYNVVDRSRDGALSCLHSGQGQRQSGLARSRSPLCRPPEECRLAGARAGLARWRLERDGRRLLFRILASPPRHPAIPDPERLDQVPVDGLGLGEAVLRPLVGGLPGRHAARQPLDPPRGADLLSRMVRRIEAECRPQADGGGGRQRHRRAGNDRRKAGVRHLRRARSCRLRGDLRPIDRRDAAPPWRRVSGERTTSGSVTTSAWVGGRSSGPG